MRVALYARVSTTRQAQAQGIEQQLDRLRAAASVPRALPVRAISRRQCQQARTIRAEILAHAHNHPARLTVARDAVRQTGRVTPELAGGDPASSGPVPQAGVEMKSGGPGRLIIAGTTEGSASP